ncbi:Hypothetical predicted protein [Mytilus galloprovincialis]|uniref:Uncharacterized protein n=1 Tax=Mytilus galloprovincialis TaxID=29158 RepID=A0A8B6DS58_MYTGA|nr:Hypothetical predicted protein [Mytilus galloprovincialis]
MTHDEESQQWIVNYPWIKNPNNLPNNVNSAVSRLGSTEKRLLRNSLKYASAYDEQIMDMVKRGIARKLTKEEMRDIAVRYITYHIMRQESIALAGDISKNVQCDKTFTVRSAHTPICVEKFRNTQRSRSLCIVDSYFWRQTEWSYFDACITSNSTKCINTYTQMHQTW